LIENIPSDIMIFYVLAIALISGKLLEELFVRLKFPAVLGDLVAGIIVGASLLNIYIVNDITKALAWFGVALLLFYAGLSTRYSEFIKLLPVAGILTIGEAIGAFSMGLIVGLLIMHYGLLESFFLGAILEATSISLTVRTLMEMNKLHTIEGYTVMEIAVLDDLSSLITIAIGSSIALLGTISLPNISLVFIKAFGAWILIVYLLHRFSNKIVGLISRFHVEEALTALLMGLFAGIAVLISFFGVSPLVGAYATGLALSEIRGLRHLRDVFRKLAIVFSTVFFVTTAAEIDLRTAIRLEYLGFYIIMVIAAFLGKLLGAGLTSFLLGFPPRSSLRIAVGLFPRCEFAIIAAYTAVSLGLLGAEAYLSAFIVVIVTNLVTPIFLKRIYSGPETRCVRLRFPRRVLKAGA